MANAIWTIEFSHSGGSFVDITKYLNGNNLSKLPFVSRNTDWTYKSKNFTFSVHKTSSIINSVTRGDEIKVKRNGTVFYNGYVTEFQLDTSRFIFSITTNSLVLKLKQYQLFNTELDSFLQDTSNWYEYNPSDVNAWTTVYVHWLLKCLFEKIGCTLDTSAVENLTMGYSLTLLRDVKFKELFLDYQNMFLIGYVNACGYANVNRTTIITLFEFLSELCSALRIVFYQTGDKAFKLAFGTVLQNMEDDPLEIYEQEDTDRLQANASLDWFYEGNKQSESNISRERFYQSTVYTDLSEVKSGSGKGTINFLNNFTLMANDDMDGESAYSYTVPCLARAEDSDTGNTYMRYNPARKKFIAATKSVLLKRASFEFDNSIVQVAGHDIDMVLDHSIIEQEVFG